MGCNRQWTIFVCRPLFMCTANWCMRPHTHIRLQKMLQKIYKQLKYWRNKAISYISFYPKATVKYKELQVTCLQAYKLNPRDKLAWELRHIAKAFSQRNIRPSTLLLSVISWMRENGSWKSVQERAVDGGGRQGFARIHQGTWKRAVEPYSQGYR